MNCFDLIELDMHEHDVLNINITHNCDFTLKCFEFDRIYN